MTTYYCYILYNEHDRTYNGYTVNLARRLRQHNGALQGGARATRGKGPWHFLVVLTSPRWTSVSTAMQHEWSIKYPTRRRPRPKEYNGKTGRLRSLCAVFQHMQERLQCEDVHCYVHADYYDMMCAWVTQNAHDTMVQVKPFDQLVVDSPDNNNNNNNTNNNNANI